MARLFRSTAVSVIILVAFLNTAALAQTNKVSISGQVTDPSGAVLKGAQIHLLPQGTTMASDALGDFFIPDLAPGDYKLAISYVGFNPSKPASL